MKYSLETYDTKTGRALMSYTGEGEDAEDAAAILRSELADYPEYLRLGPDAWGVRACPDREISATIATASGQWRVQISATYPEYASGTAGFGRGAASCEPPHRQREMIAALRAQPGADDPRIAKAIDAFERAAV